MPISTSKLSLIDGDTTRGLDVILGTIGASDRHPPVIKIHNNIQHAQLIHATWGNDTVVVMRQTATEYIISNGMAQGLPDSIIASAWFEATRPFMAAAPWAYFEVGAPGFNADDPAVATYYANIIMQCMHLMSAAGYKGVVLTFYEGTPRTVSDGVDGWAPYWPVVTLAAQMGYLLGMQGYWIDGQMSLSDEWHCFRALRVLRDYPGKFPPGTRIVLTEYGIDLRNGQGWKAALGNDAARYMAGLQAADMQWRSATLPAGVTILGCTAFVLQEWGSQWDDFNLWEILPQMLSYIKSQDAVVTPPPVDPPPVDPPPVDPPPVNAPNILQNPSFSEGSHKESADLDVPNKWNVWQGSDFGAIHTEVDTDPPYVIDGYAGRMWQSNSTRGAAFTQVVPVAMGAEYTLTAHHYNWSTDNPIKGNPSQADIAVAVGIDPYGGNDPLSSAVVWSSMDMTRDAYSEVSIAAIAKNTVITVYLFAAPLEMRARNDVRWAACSLKQSKPAPDPISLHVARVTSPDGVNQRAEPSVTATKLGMITGTDSPKTYVVIEKPAVNGYVKAAGQPWWIIEKNLTTEN